MSSPTTTAPGPIPSPDAHPVWGHLGRFGTDPLALLREGAALGPLFELRLPRRPALVGVTPSWNRFVLRDPETFRSRGSLPSLVPHLAGGIIVTDAPAHRSRRAQLDTPFRDVEGLRRRVRAAIEPLLPSGPFEGLGWAIETVKAMLNAAMFSGRFPPELLDDYLRPLEQGMPSALIPRPLTRRAVRRELAAQVTARRSHRPADPTHRPADPTHRPADPTRESRDLAGALAEVPGAVEELRVGLAAGFDTTAHTLAWSLWYLGREPQWQHPERRRAAIDEVLRLHPPGFISARKTARTTVFEGVTIQRGTHVFASPLLTNRSPDLWDEPETFDPTRFERGVQGWSYLPFSAGPRTCLGMHLARLLLDEALDAVLQLPLRALDGDPSPHAGVTIAPTGPLHLVREPTPRPRPTRPFDPGARP
jgi:cytochrome P450